MGIRDLVRPGIKAVSEPWRFFFSASMQGSLLLPRLLPSAHGPLGGFGIVFVISTWGDTRRACSALLSFPLLSRRCLFYELTATSAAMNTVGFHQRPASFILLSSTFASPPVVNNLARDEEYRVYGCGAMLPSRASERPQSAVTPRWKILNPRLDSPLLGTSFVVIESNCRGDRVGL